MIHNFLTILGSTYPPASSGASPMAPVITNSAATKSATSTAIRIGNQVSNRILPIEDQGADQKLSDDHDSDVTLAASSGANDGNSDYVESCKNSPANSYNSPELETIIE